MSGRCATHYNLAIHHLCPENREKGGSGIDFDLEEHKEAARKHGAAILAALRDQVCERCQTPDRKNQHRFWLCITTPAGLVQNTTLSSLDPNFDWAFDRALEKLAEDGK